MIVAIVDQTSPTGLVPVEEFRIAASTTAAVDAFVGEYTPPKNAADYLGVDPGWSDYQPSVGGLWCYDFGTGELVAQQQHPADHYEATYQTGRLTSEAWYGDEARTLLSRDIVYTWLGNALTAEVHTEYWNDGSIRSQQSYTWSGSPLLRVRTLDA